MTVNANDGDGRMRDGKQFYGWAVERILPKHERIIFSVAHPCVSYCLVFLTYSLS